ncbi:hypothetical protein [Bdellovibrio sp. GT3]|uniref:hypothetical protein n=1 Tax=Bdellovibrio sp. GT3 TaxID=3136282 RepID=UPI0030F26FBB
MAAKKAVKQAQPRKQLRETTITVVSFPQPQQPNTVVRVDLATLMTVVFALYEFLERHPVILDTVMQFFR